MEIVFEFNFLLNSLLIIIVTGFISASLPLEESLKSLAHSQSPSTIALWIPILLISCPFSDRLNSPDAPFRVQRRTTRGKSSQTLGQWKWEISACVACKNKHFSARPLAMEWKWRTTSWVGHSSAHYTGTLAELAGMSLSLCDVNWI